MIASITAFIAASATVVSGASIPVRRSDSASITPHDQYSSSIGVLGCKIDTNRVAYWPSSVGCDDLCVKVTHDGRSTHLLKIDTSGGAHDISYDAWNYLGFGESAKDDPHMGGGIDMEYETVSMDECKDLLDDGKLPLSAANSMNYVAACLAEPDSWVAKNYVLYNIMDSVCTIGHDEKCELDLAVSNQPSCPSGLGMPGDLKDEKVVNIAYGTGDEVDA
ncbi:Cerato-platanin [Sarocladium implicatum]|nr:Cerato-platanin [Sarocladium implicatum]